VLSGGRSEVLDAAREVIEASLDAGAHVVQVKVEVEGDAARFGGSSQLTGGREGPIGRVAGHEES
jgi:hypothetical protein